MSDHEGNNQKPSGGDSNIVADIDRRSFLRLGALAGAAAATVPGLARPAESRARPGRAGAGRVDDGNDINIVEASIAQLQAAMTAGHLTAESLVGRYLERIEALDEHGPKVNSIIETNPDARDIARALDAERRAHGPRGPLHGIPILLKDNIDTADHMQTAAGSLALVGSPPLQDATVAAKLRQAGAIIIAKSNMHEFAYGITTLGSLFGQTRNPYALDRNPGGSSGGTGAAIAANFAAAGMGSDTCGSIRISASHNSLVGIRGTQSLASRKGTNPQ